MDEGGGHAGNAGDGDDKAPVTLDALHHTFDPLENSSGHTDLLALQELAVHLVEGYEAVLRGGGDEHEIAHLPFVNGLRLLTFRVTVEVEGTRVVQNQRIYVFPCAADEKEIGHNRSDVALHAVALDSILDPRTILNHLRGIPAGLLVYCFHLDLMV